MADPATLLRAILDAPAPAHDRRAAFGRVLAEATRELEIEIARLRKEMEARRDGR